MSKQNRKAKTQSAKTVATVEVATVEQSAAPVETTAAVAARVAKQVNRLPFEQAKAHNTAIAPVDPNAPVPAGIVQTAKGTNLAKRRVYGYDNGSAGLGVPKSATVVVVPGFMGTPKAVNPQSWAKLLEIVQANPATTVEQLYAALGNANPGRIVRRSFRAGAIRFQQVGIKQS